MRFDKKHKSLAVLVYFIFLLLAANGQKNVDTPKTNTKRKEQKQECNLINLQQHIFTKVDVLASFQNNAAKWFDYAQSNFDFKSAINYLSDTVQYFHDSVFVRFIVTKSGQICNVEILRGNQILSDPVIKLIKKSARWHPASSEGRNLNAYRTLKVEITIDKKKNEFKVIRNFNSYYNQDG